LKSCFTADKRASAASRASSSIPKKLPAQETFFQKIKTLKPKQKREREGQETGQQTD